MASDNYLELSGLQFGRLSQALRDTLSLNQFDEMLKQRLDINRSNITIERNYISIVFEVINEANRGGWVYRLVDAARQERPSNPIFVEYAQIIGMGPYSSLDKAELHSVIKRSNRFIDISELIQKLGEIEGQVCRIDLNGEGEGTGFLVGPNLVMTNYHVITSIFKSGLCEKAIDYEQLNKLTCRFDFKVRRDGVTVNKGTVFRVVDIPKFRPFDPADLSKGSEVPMPENLDYAILTLESDPGNEPIGGIAVDANTPQRGWIELRSESHEFIPQSPLFVVQHPDKRPMKIALDTEAIIGLNENHTRVEYTTNAAPGSSGSPCFDQNWELVALHHSGDPNWIPTWNEGIPIDLIFHDLSKTN